MRADRVPASLPDPEANLHRAVGLFGSIAAAMILASCAGTSTTSSNAPTAGTTRDATTATATATPSTSLTAEERNRITGSTATFVQSFVFSGKVAGVMTRSTATGRLCQQPLTRIEALFAGMVGGRIVHIQVIIDPATSGPTKAVIVVPDPDGQQATSGPYGANSSGWSTYRGSAIVGADGMSASIIGDLAVGGGPVVEHVSGAWKCQVAP